MTLDTAQAPKANGLKTALDMVIAPKDALESLRVAPTWGWAYLIAAAIMIGSYFVMLPAVHHVTVIELTKQFSTNPQMAALTPEQQQQQLKVVGALLPFFAFIPPIALLLFCLLQTVIMLVFNALGRGSGKFSSFWATSINISIVAALGQVIAAVVVILRGADSFASQAELNRAVPSLALLVPGGDVKLLGFLATLNPFTIWMTVLVFFTMTIVARVPKLQAWLTAIISFLIPALFATLTAK